MIVVDRAISIACGTVRPVPNAFYCAGDRTIYLVPQFLVDQERQFGDYAPIAILSHEWGHHVQNLLVVTGPSRKQMELQADCLMGAFTRHADERGLLDYGDFLEVLSSAIDAGDDVFLPEDCPGAHGQPEDRVKALTKGYGGGPVIGCQLPFRTGSAPAPTPPSQTLPPISMFPRFPQPPVNESLVLPRSLPLSHAACFRTERDGVFTLQEVISRLGAMPDASSRMQQWGWQDGNYRAFACAGPPKGEASWVEINLHCFADAASAWAAVDFFAAARSAGTTLMRADPPGAGDHVVALTGPAVNGKEFTIYASQGPILLRVTDVSPSGIPFMNVLTIAQSVLATQPRTAQQPASQANAPMSAATFLPDRLPLAHADCFDVREDETLSFDEVSNRFPDPAEAAPLLRGWGWQRSDYRSFTGASAPAGQAAWIDASAHQFADANSLRQALNSFVEARVAYGYLSYTLAPTIGEQSAALTGPTPTGTEYTLYATSGPFLVRVTGIAPSGTPSGGVVAVMEQILVAMP